MYSVGSGRVTPQAYPYGAVFSRESVRARQQEGFSRSARELEQGLIQVAAGQAVAGARGGGIDLGGAIMAGRELANSLRGARAAGRMVVEANPVVLAGRPELDVLLEPGDLIAVPKRPNEVTVVGAVLNPGSLQFATGWRAADYVRAAGGEQRFSDPGRAFVVLPNGQSTPAGLGAWQAGGPPVPPGSLVVVPQDPSPYETWGFLRDATQVLSQVALSTAALAVIVRTGSARYGQTPTAAWAHSHGSNAALPRRGSCARGAWACWGGQSSSWRARSRVQWSEPSSAAPSLWRLQRHRATWRALSITLARLASEWLASSVACSGLSWAGPPA